MPPSAILQPDVAQAMQTLDNSLAIDVNARFCLRAPRKDIAYCRYKVFWRCTCAADVPHLLFTSRKALLDRIKARPVAPLWTLHCTLPPDISPEHVGHRDPSALELQLVEGLAEECSAVLARWVAHLAHLNVDVMQILLEAGGDEEEEEVAYRWLAHVERAAEPVEQARALGLRPAGPFFAAEARSLPGRVKSSPDVSLMRPFGVGLRRGGESAAGSRGPFGAVMQVDGQQHLHGSFFTRASQQQREIDYANDLDAWVHFLPVLRIAYSDAALLATARRLFLLAVLANPRARFIMYTRTFYTCMDWHWMLTRLGATRICRLRAHGVFVVSERKLTLLEVDDSVPVPPLEPDPDPDPDPDAEREQGAARPRGSGAGAAAAAATPAIRSVYDPPAGPSGLQRVQKKAVKHAGGRGLEQHEQRQQQQPAADGQQVLAAHGVTSPPELQDTAPEFVPSEDLRLFVERSGKRHGEMLASRRRREDAEAAAAEKAEAEAQARAEARAALLARFGEGRRRREDESPGDSIDHETQLHDDN